MKKIDLNKLNDKYVIMSGTHKIVYDLDDERIFSIGSVGSGRGSSFACFNKSAIFNGLSDANKGIKYLNGCYFVCDFEPIKISNLIKTNSILYNELIDDIKEHNEKVKAHYISIKEAKKITENTPKSINYNGESFAFNSSNNGVEIYVKDDSTSSIVVKDGNVLFEINGCCSQNFGFVDIHMV